MNSYHYLIVGRLLKGDKFRRVISDERNLHYHNFWDCNIWKVNSETLKRKLIYRVRNGSWQKLENTDETQR